MEACVAAIISLFVVTESKADDKQSIMRGAAYARTNCAECHNIERTGDSPFPRSPPFRTMTIRYLIADLILPLGSGQHPPMPKFDVTRNQAVDLMAFINSLK